MRTKGSLAILAALSLSLFACGGGASTASTTSAADSAASAVEATSAGATSATGTASATSATSATGTTKTATSIVGSWKPAGMEMEGIKMFGDLGQAASIFGGDDETESILQMTFVANEDGTGAMTANGETANFTWKESGKGYALSITSVQGETSESTATLENGVLKLMIDEYGLLMTPDGSYPEKGFDPTAAKPVTTESELTGTWKLSGVYMAGLTMTGDEEALLDLFGYDESTVVFEAGGKVKLFGDDETYSVSASGATLSDKANNFSAPITAADSLLFIDMSSLSGSAMYMVLSK